MKSFLLIFVLVPSISYSQTISFQAAPTNLLASYAMSNGMDSSGNGKNGLLLSTTTVMGKYADAQRFTGSGRMTIPSFNVGTAFTIETWVYLEQLTRTSGPSVRAASQGWQAIIFKGGNTGETDNFFLAEAQQFITTGFTPVGSNQVAQLIAPSRISVNAWHHIAGTYNGTTLSLIIDGVNVASMSVTGSVRPSTAPIEVGGTVAYSGALNGIIDDIRIYSRGLGLSEVVSDMATPVDTVREPIVSWQMEVWKGIPTTGQMVAQGNFPKTGALCNLPPLPASTMPIINPTKARLSDPDLPMRECELVIQTLIESVPVGLGYVSTLIAKGGTTQSERSGASNSFDRVASATPPLVPGTPVVR